MEGRRVKLNVSLCTLFPFRSEVKTGHHSGGVSALCVGGGGGLGRNSNHGRPGMVACFVHVLAFLLLILSFHRSHHPVLCGGVRFFFFLSFLLLLFVESSFFRIISRMKKKGRISPSFSVDSTKTISSQMNMMIDISHNIHLTS